MWNAVTEASWTPGRVVCRTEELIVHPDSPFSGRSKLRLSRPPTQTASPLRVPMLSLRGFHGIQKNLKRPLSHAEEPRAVLSAASGSAASGSAASGSAYGLIVPFPVRRRDHITAPRNGDSLMRLQRSSFLSRIHADRTHLLNRADPGESRSPAKNQCVMLL
ncbi:hypothetical protein CesoFtcFv8_012121 [Champsocephalus esox]|uniref:Uncharacterized protein n=1 Tax=Champsocephalus esox TaxID=159716 RepID=A0AAN8GTN7_9TELE|nr:hypothetical protein CesoFtcFv8_012121 [Champsocephalus esox]